MSLTVRRVERGERAAVDRVVETALKHANAYFEDAPALHDGDRFAEYVDAGGDFLVGVLDGEIVATAAFRPPKGLVADRLDTEGLAEVKRMHVHPTYHRRGYGQAMYDELETRARTAGYDRLGLSTTARQDAAHAFYEQNGFAEADRVTESLENESLTILVYEKAL